MTESPITSLHSLQVRKEDTQAHCDNCGKETATMRFLFQATIGAGRFSRPTALCRECTQLAVQFLTASWEPEHI
jgi:hypothetical protein